ncbi:MAG: response regulator transcription factor, partial [Ornithinimicrobium sp.]
MQNMKSVLVVTDEPTVSGPIVQVLRREGHAVDIAANVAPGLDVAVRSPHDLVILDLARTDLDGADLCQQMREGGVRAPVLVLTTRCGETDIVVALDAGADDYVIRPFRVAELLARVRALLRRGDHARENTDRSITMDRGARLAFLNGRELTLTAKEFDILAVLLREQGNVVTRT